MIANALVVPVESPPTLLEIKRSLLTYDCVFMFDPADRDLLPRHMFLNAYSGGKIPFSPMEAGPIRPIGKVERYDESFSQVWEAAHNAVKSGNLKIYSPNTVNDPLPGSVWFPPPAPFFDPGKYTYVAANYRSLAHQKELLEMVLPNRQNIDNIITNRETDWDQLAPKGLDNTPPSIESEGSSIKVFPELATLSEVRGIPNAVLENLGRNRLGSITKAAMEAHESNLNLVTSDLGVLNVLTKLSSHSHIRDISSSSDTFEQLFLLSRVSRIIVTEFVDDKLLHSKSIPEILRLRSSAWGKERENRALLLREIRDIAASSYDDAGFDFRVRNSVKKYMDTNQPNLNTLKANGLQIGISIIAASAVQLAIESYFRASPTSIALLIAAAAPAASEVTSKFLINYLQRSARDYEGYSIGKTYGPFLRGA